MPKLSANRRLLLLANIVNLLVAIYFTLIAVVALAQLRWYHQLTVSVKVGYFISLATSYFAFFLLIFVGVLLIGLFVSSSLTLSKSSGGRGLVPSIDEDAINAVPPPLRPTATATKIDDNNSQQLQNDNISLQGPAQQIAQQHQHLQLHQQHKHQCQRHSAPKHQTRVSLRRSSLSTDSQSSACCSIALHLVICVGLIATLMVWLYNTGELVRDSISTQLDYAFARYQFTNRSSQLTVAIDGIQDINNCCGSLHYTDFPHHRSGLSQSHYPGSCCGKHMFGVQAQIVCLASEVERSKRMTGCTVILANYYDLISLLIVPVALVSLFVNITIIALITISKGVAHEEDLDTVTGHHNCRLAPTNTTAFDRRHK